MKLYKYLLLIFLFFIVFPSVINAQFISKNIEIGDTTQVHVINTENGDRFVGRVTRIENTTVFFLFQNKKELEFSLSEISSLVLFKEQKPGTTNSTPSTPSQNPDYDRAKAEYENRHGSKNEPAILNGAENLFFSPTAFTHGKGNGEYRNIMVLYNRVDFGLTDNIDLGFDIMPLIAVNVFSARIKAGIPINDYLNVGFGGSVFMALQPSIFNNNQVEGTTYTYGAATIGTKEKFMNVGFGYAFPFEPERTEGATVLSFGGALRLGNHWKLIADFILMDLEFDPDYYSLGVSWFNNRNRVDFGINTFAFPERSFTGPIIPIPFASYARTFGNK